MLPETTNGILQKKKGELTYMIKILKEEIAHGKTLQIPKNYRCHNYILSY